MGNAVLHQRISESIYADTYQSTLALSDIQQYYSTNYRSNKSTTRANTTIPRPRKPTRKYTVIRKNLKDALKLHSIVKEINSRHQTKSSYSQSILAPNNNYASAYSSGRYNTTQGENSVMSLTSVMQQHGIDSGMFRQSPAISAQRNLPLPANNENLERSNNFRHENSGLALQDRSNSTPHMQNSHQLINKAYKAIRCSRRQESGRDHLLPTATATATATATVVEQIAEDPVTSESNISSLNNTEERPMKRRICLKSKSANKLSQKPNNFNAQEFLNELENIRSVSRNQLLPHCSPNESIPISTRQEQDLVENYLKSHHETSPSPHKEYNTQNSEKSAEPAVKHKVLLQSSANKNKRDASYDSLPSAPSAQKHQHYYGLRAVSPPPNNPKEGSPSVYTQILSKHYDLSDIKTRFQGSNNSKRVTSSSPSPNDKRRPMQNYEQPTLSQVQRINFGHLNSAGKSSLMSYTDDEERREDRLIPLHAVRKQDEYRRDNINRTPPTKNLSSSATKSGGVNVGDFNIDTRQLLLSVEKKASTLNLEEINKKRSRSSSPLQRLSSSYNSNNILRESNAYQQENCNSVLSDINLKIEGILQKCCELTEKSAKGLEKLNSSRSFRKASTATMERGGYSEPVQNTANTANTVNTQDTGRDTGRELIRLTSEESTADFRKPEKNYWSAASIENESQRFFTEEQQGKEFEDVLAEDRALKRHEETIIEEEEEASKDMMYLESQQKLEQETRYNSSPVHNNSQQNEGVYSVYSDIIVKEPESVWNTSGGIGQLIFTSEQNSHLMSFGSAKKNYLTNFRSKNADYLSSHIYTDELNSKEGIKPPSEIAVKVEAAMSSANSLQAQVNARQDSHFPTGPSESLTKEKLEKEISTAVHELESISKVLKNNERFVSTVGLEQVQTVLMQKIGAIHEDILTRIEQLNQKIESKSAALSTRRKSSAAISHVSNEPITKPNTKTEIDNTKNQSMNISDLEAIQGHQSFLNQSSLPKPDSARSTVYIQSQTLNHSTHQDQAKAFEPVLTFGSIKGPYSSKEDVKRLQKSKSQSKYEPKQVNISIPKIMEHATSRSTNKTNRREVEQMSVFKDVSPISHKNDVLKGSLFEDVSIIGRSGRSTQKGSISNIKRDASTNTEKTTESVDETPRPTTMPMQQVQMFGRKNETTKKPKARDMGEKKWSNEKLRNGFSKYMKTIYGEDNFNDTVSLVVQTEPGYDEMNGKLASIYEERYLNLLNRELRQKNLKRYNMDNSDYHDLAFEKQILAAKYHTFAQNEEKEYSQPEQQSPSPEHTIKSEGIPSEKKKLAVDLMSLSSLRRNRDLETPDENIQKLEEWLDVHVPGSAAQTQNQQKQQKQQQLNSSSASSKTKTQSKDHKLKVLKIQNLIKQAQGKPVKDEQYHHQGSLFYTEGNEVEEDFSWLDASASQSRINRSSVLSTKLSNYDPNRSHSRDNGRLSVKSGQGKSVNRNVSSVKKGENTSSTKKNAASETTDRRNLLKNVYLESLNSVSSFEVGRENRGGMQESKVQASNKKTYTPEKKGAASAKKIVVGKSTDKKRFEERISEDRIKNFGMVRKY